MVPAKNGIAVYNRRLSVLALSSRFDGPGSKPMREFHALAFSTRSVESF